MQLGSDIIIQLHYTTNGTAGSDKTRVGLVFAKAPPKLRNVTLAASNKGFAIPPNAANYEVKSQVKLQDTMTLLDLAPHMHYRGKDFLCDAIFSNGEMQTLLSVKYDFNWQLDYRLADPLVLPKGARIECTAHFDNSANNPNNPDPTKTVSWGEQSWNEMMMVQFSVGVDVKVDTTRLIRLEKPGTR